MFEFLFFIIGISISPVNLLLAGTVVSLMTHFISDFHFQNDDEARQKSSNNKVLAIHCLKYSVFFILVIGPMFAIVNALLHFATDYFTSRAAKRAFLEERRHDFFCIIGFDQLIHTLTLITTFYIEFFVL